MEWKRHGAGLVSTVDLVDGREGKVVIVGARDNPRGAMLVLPATDAQDVRVADSIDLLHPRQLVEVLCAQERMFGSSGLIPFETP